MTFIKELAIGAIGPVLYGQINDEYRDRAIQIDTGDITPFNLNISKKEVDQLIAAGKQAVSDFFALEKQCSVVSNIVNFGKIWSTLEPEIQVKTVSDVACVDIYG